MKLPLLPHGRGRTLDQVALLGLQGFHGERIAVPIQPGDRPDRKRLEERFERFSRSSA